MNDELVAEFRYFRERGFTFDAALRSARTKVEFDRRGGAYEDALHSSRDALIRVRCEPDQEMYDDSYMETWGLTERQLQYQKDELYRRINANGVWGLIAEYRATSDAPWIQAGSVWGIEGDWTYDPEWSGTMTEMRREALDGLDTLETEEAYWLSQRATYAGIPQGVDV